MTIPPLSILDLVPVAEGATPADALRDSLELARAAERLGYRRYWVAEHHNMEGIASAATSVVLGYLAAGTSTLRLGAGGIMLPNHSPLVVAEQFGTLESLYPGRIELGLGRAPGTDQLTAGALRRDPRRADRFPDEVLELQEYFAPAVPGQRVRAVPGAGLRVPLWILGSSTFGARLAAVLGLPYAFASHFAPAALDEALAIYRAEFRPSAELGEPYAIVGANVVVADDDATARHLFTSVQMAFTNVLRGAPGRYPPPVDDIDAHWSDRERLHVEQMLECAAVGSPETVRARLEELTARTDADEIMAVAAVHSPAARIRSYELLAQVGGGRPDPEPAAVRAG